MDRPDPAQQAPHDAPRSRRGLSARGAALVCLDDPRAEYTTMLILQELGLSVDLAADPRSALRWARHARYEVLLVGGGPTAASLALSLRGASPGSRVVLLRDTPASGEELPAFAIDVLEASGGVNALMDALRPQD